MTLAERFWTKVDKLGPDECWPWRGASDEKGRGQIWRDGKLDRAPRVAWELANDAPFPADQDACHTCDHPWCVNGLHVWPGTASHNAIDCAKKGRLKSRRLTDAQVIEIRGMPELSQSQVAAIYGVNRATIGRIRSGEMWSWLNDTPRIEAMLEQKP